MGIDGDLFFPFRSVSQPAFGKYGNDRKSGDGKNNNKQYQT